MTSLFRATSTALREYAHQHEERTKALTQPLPIAQEETTGTRSARRRPPATAGTLEQQRTSHTAREENRTGEMGFPCAKRTARPSIAQAAAVGCTAPALRLQRYVTAHCPPLLHHGSSPTNRKVFRSIGIEGSNLARGLASGADGGQIRCWFESAHYSAKVMLTHERLSTDEHDRPDCLYQTRDCSYQKARAARLHGGQSEGQSAPTAPSLRGGWRATRKPLRPVRTTPAIHFLRYTPSKKIWKIFTF